MTINQVKRIRDFSNKDDGTGKPMAYSLSAIFNNEISFTNTDNFVIYNDKDALIHCLQPNTNDVVQQCIAPFKINTGFYDNIQYLEGLYTMSNFMKAVKELFLDTGLINQTQYDAIEKWSTSIRNSIPDADPIYFKTAAQAVPKEYKVTPRVDGVTAPSAIGQHTMNDTIAKAINAAIETYMTTNKNMVNNGSNTYIMTTDNADAIKSIIRSIITAAESIEGYNYTGVQIYDKRFNKSHTIHASITNKDETSELIDAITDANSVSITVSCATSSVQYTIVVNTEEAETTQE